MQRVSHCGPLPSSASSSSSSDASADCSGFLDIIKSSNGTRHSGGSKLCDYRSRLEQEVKKLQRQLEEEIHLHMVLATAVGYNTSPSLKFASKLPDKAQELLGNISALEISVSKLEEELVALHYRLSYERSELCLFETHLRSFSPPSAELPTFTSGYTWEEHISSLRDSKLSGCQAPHSLQQGLSSSCEHSRPVTLPILSDRCRREEISGTCSPSKEIKKVDFTLQQSDEVELNQNFLMKKLWHKPNQLSEEMVRCMRNIFICLSESSTISSKESSSESIPSPSSSFGHLSRSSMTSFSDSSIRPSLMRSPSPDLYQACEVMDAESTFDPYGVSRTVSWGNIGAYTFATKVSWMSVGKEQLEYAAEALKKFRFLVEQVAKVNPARMSNNERLAFWINLYNALIMHAYLAYGVPRSDIKLFSLMLKASYILGGQTFSAADIEFVILKTKPPAHRPQIALILALHKFKISEEHRKYSIDSSEPLTLFALSCGMYSSPAVRIFTADNVHEELQDAMGDYIRASVGISEKGKLIVPRLLHSYTKGVVEDSLLVDWICRYLTPGQVSIVRDPTSRYRKQRLLGIRSFSITPFDSRFRYLYLPDSKSSGISS